MKKDAQKSVAIDEFEGTEQEYDKKLSLDDLLNTQNIADLLDEHDLISIGNRVVEG